MEWSIVRCMDGRLNKHIAKLMLLHKIPEDHDLISLPGGCRDLVDPESLASRALKDVSLDLHAVEHTLLVQHTDCGAYGGRAKCGANEAADLVFQVKELQKAIAAIQERHPKLKITAILIHILDDGTADIQQVQV